MGGRSRRLAVPPLIRHDPAAGDVRRKAGRCCRAATAARVAPSWALLDARAAARAELTVTGTQTLSPRLDPVHRDERCARALDQHPRAAARGVRRGAERRYPVLLLLHGCCDDYRSWVDKGRAEQLTAPLPADRRDARRRQRRAGTATRYNAGAFGPPRVRDLRLRGAAAVGRRDVPLRPAERAVAGLSMGGFGALKYAARHPGVFQAAASYSGVVDAPVVRGQRLREPDPGRRSGARAPPSSRAGASTTRSTWPRACAG